MGCQSELQQNAYIKNHNAELNCNLVHLIFHHIFEEEIQLNKKFNT